MDPLEQVAQMLTNLRDQGYAIVAVLSACAALVGIALWATAGGNSRQVETGKTWTVRAGVSAIALVALPFIVNWFGQLLGLPDVGFSFGR
jgi:hypothetical protein